jgi:hypothetical protein
MIFSGTFAPARRTQAPNPGVFGPTRRPASSLRISQSSRPPSGTGRMRGLYLAKGRAVKAERTSS